MKSAMRNPQSEVGGQPLRVLVVASLFPHAKNETIGLSTLRRTVELAKRCEVKVVALTGRRDLPEREAMGGVEVLRPRWRRIPKLGVFLDGYRYAARLAAVARELRAAFEFDLLDAHWLYPDGFAAVRAGRRFGRPVAVTGRGSDVNDFCFHWAVGPFARSVLRGADRLFAVSRQLRDRMVEAGAPPERVSVVPNGVDTNLFRPGERDAARCALGLPLHQRVLLSVGPMLPAKGFQHLIAGLALLDGGETPHLYIAGPGDYQRALERQAERLGLASRVKFLGRVAQGQMPLWYQAADLFCFGSLREGCPNVVLEALACGTPVVSTNVGGIPDLVEEGFSGLLFEPGSPEAFAEALKAALARPWDRAAIAAAGARRSWAKVAEEYLTVFQHMVPSRGAT